VADGQWTPIIVEERLEEAASVLKRLPPVKVQGYYSLWPRYVYEFADLVGQEPNEMRLPPPSAAAITRMDEAMEWLKLLEPDDAKLVWLRAERTQWKHICVRLGMSRATAHRHWQYAMVLIAWRLNGLRASAKPLRRLLAGRPRTCQASTVLRDNY
jgi:hypothetical protein